MAAKATRFHAIGPNFLNGKLLLARRRLPPNCVAHTDSDEALSLAIRDLYVYAVQKAKIKPLQSLVFRVVDESERDAINHRIHALLGPQEFLEASSTFCPATGDLHILDSEHLAHVCNRHADPKSEPLKGHVPISISEIEMIPQVVRPRNIAEFSRKKESPRIVYRKAVENGTLVAVQELRRGKGHAVLKTLYLQK